MRIALLTREYPPEIYGGAGVHVEYLGKELAKLVDLDVYCFGGPRSGEEVKGHFDWWDALAGDDPHLASLRTMAVNLEMSAAVQGADLVHSHTWYANFAGMLGQLMYSIPHVMTSHSLEPLRPWKEEQLGGGYRVSRYIEAQSAKTADKIIAVSEGMKRDILRAYPEVSAGKVEVIYNGIDTAEYSPRPTAESQRAVENLGLDPQRPIATFVGRITRQKGVVHLLEAAEYLAPEVQLLLCAGAPDTKEIAEEFQKLVGDLKERRQGVVWVEEMLPRPEVIRLLSGSTVFVCPSVYEPFGIVNVEAMGCGLPVVASAVGGIPEVVVDGETGYLVHFEQDEMGNPIDREAFARDLAAKVNAVVESREGAKAMGQAGRERALSTFSWESIAQETKALYASLIR
ncbi:MAG: glycogen synthase [Polyangiaceae bacterium]|nr:glycogen synthase [Polyangiaceae bacterium]